MNRLRQASTISLLYSLPLLVWMSAQLRYTMVGGTDLRFLFNQMLGGLVLLQAFAMILLLINNPLRKWQDEALGVLYVLLFPMPFLALIGLTGGASLLVIIKSLMLVGAVGIFAFLIQRCGGLITDRLKILRSCLSLAHVLLAVTLWNFREHWQDWLAL